ncbi:MAG: DUF4019 domain-containing protein [Desulfosarcinaceae bacterium]
MRIKKQYLATCAVVFMTSIAGSLWADSTKASNALKAADAWLSMVDAGKYSESWQDASNFFKSAVGESQWEASLNAARKPLGKVLSREAVSKTYTKTLPGAPDGEYVVIQYRTSFENKGSAVETVTPSLEKDGRWRVSGYYIK